ncbi:hypothetical protein BGZ83_003591, partial [Gryganskiella cystojenkinii]
MSITSTDTPLCVASNSDEVYTATLDNSQAYRGRPPAVVIYKSQRNPISLASIKWTSVNSTLINGAVPNYLPLDTNGYFCAVTDGGAFAILSGVQNTSQISGGMGGYGHLVGLLYTPPPYSYDGPVSGVVIHDLGGPTATVGFTNVLSKGYYSCIVNSEKCSGYLYALPGITTSSFVLAMYNSTGYTFEVLDGATQKFTTFLNNPVSTPVTPNAYGFTGSLFTADSKFVTVTSSGAQRYDLNSTGLPAQVNGTTLTSNNDWDGTAMTECGSGILTRGAYASVHGYAYFSCVSNGKRLVLSTNGSTPIKKISTVTERTDVVIQGVVPVPGPYLGESKWALAYSTTQAVGLYGLTLTGSWEDQQAESTKAGIIYGVCASVVVILALTGFFYWRRKKQQRAKQADEVTAQYPDTKLEHHEGKTPHHPASSPALPLAQVNGGAHTGFSNVPVLEAPFPPLPPGSQGQQSQPPYLPQSHHSQYSQPQFPQQSSQQFPQQYPQHSSQLLSQQGLH